MPLDNFGTPDQTPENNPINKVEDTTHGLAHELAAELTDAPLTDARKVELAHPETITSINSKAEVEYLVEENDYGTLSFPLIKNIRPDLVLAMGKAMETCQIFEVSFDGITDENLTPQLAEALAQLRAPLNLMGIKKPNLTSLSAFTKEYSSDAPANVAQHTIDFGIAEENMDEELAQVLGMIKTERLGLSKYVATDLTKLLLLKDAKAVKIAFSPESDPYFLRDLYEAGYAGHIYRNAQLVAR